MREVYGGVRQVTFATDDLAAARRFWVDRLGFAPIDEEEGRFVRVNLGTFRLRLEPPLPGERVSPTRAALTFKVKDLSATARELDARDVGYEMLTTHATGDRLETSDPDGHRIVFTERL